MANHFYAYISRMRCVKRWALMRNTEEENIQEHSHMVAVLAHALALIRTRVFGLPTDANAVAVAALYHDATEILTGDMPTPIKYYNPEIRDAYRKVEAVASDKLLSMLPQELRGGAMQLIGFLLLWALLFTFVWFTYRPPHLPLFLDPVSGCYGLETPC